jgi:hypothetical protein
MPHDRCKMQGNPVARFHQLVCQPCVFFFFPNAMYHHGRLATEAMIPLCLRLGCEQIAKAVSIAITPPRHHVSTSKCQVAVVVHCQHTVESHPYASSKPWDDWRFLACLKCPALVLTWPMACHEGYAILPIRLTD